MLARVGDCFARVRERPPVMAVVVVCVVERYMRAAPVVVRAEVGRQGASGKQ